MSETLVLTDLLSSSVAAAGPNPNGSAALFHHLFALQRDAVRDVPEAVAPDPELVVRSATSTVPGEPLPLLSQPSFRDRWASPELASSPPSPALKDLIPVPIQPAPPVSDERVAEPGTLHASQWRPREALSHPQPGRERLVVGEPSRLPLALRLDLSGPPTAGETATADAREFIVSGGGAVATAATSRQDASIGRGLLPVAAPVSEVVAARELGEPVRPDPLQTHDLGFGENDVEPAAERTEHLSSSRAQAQSPVPASSVPTSGSITPAPSVAGDVAPRPLDLTLQKAEAPLPVVELAGEEATEQLRGQITLMMRSGIRTARIEAKPRELGLIDIAVRMEQQRVDVEIVGSTGEVRELLAEQAPKLRWLLEKSGVEVGSMDVGSERRDPDQPQQERADSRTLTFAAPVDTTTATVTRPLHAHAGLDVYA